MNENANPIVADKFKLGKKKKNNKLPPDYHVCETKKVFLTQEQLERVIKTLKEGN